MVAKKKPTKRTPAQKRADNLKRLKHAGYELHTYETIAEADAFIDGVNASADPECESDARLIYPMLEHHQCIVALKLGEREELELESYDAPRYAHI